ncbi:hypothetical protein K2X33_00595, partial [bacterium]|nr:hypothetical protein [bacterium]
MVILLVTALVLVADAPQAEGRLFNRGGRRIFPIFPLFRRPLFNRRPAQLINRNVRRGNDVNNNINRRINFNNIEDIPGFARLAIANGVIVERPRGGGGLVNRLIIDGFGRLLVQPFFGNRFVGNFRLASAETVQHLKEFYLKNIDNFPNGILPNAVDRFLRANVANSGIFGQLSASIQNVGNRAVSVRPQDPRYKDISDEKIRTAALAFLMNTLSNSCTPLNFSTGDIDAAG